jgi:hypothetical protein
VGIFGIVAGTGLVVLMKANAPKPAMVQTPGSTFHPVKTEDNMTAIPDLAKIQEKTKSNSEAELIKEKEGFYNRCVEKIKWASDTGWDRIVVYFYHGNKEDHKDTISKLIKAGYKVEFLVGGGGISISWKKD